MNNSSNYVTSILILLIIIVVMWYISSNSSINHFDTSQDIKNAITGVANEYLKKELVSDVSNKVDDFTHKLSR